MPKVAVLGWYGHNNVGDNLILQGIRSLFVNHDITVMNRLNLKEINKCDLLVLGGGELIPEWLYLRQLPFGVRGLANRTLKNRSWMHKVKIPKIVLGCGIDSNTITEQDVTVLEQFDYIGLRDNKSVEMLKEHKTLENRARLFYDLAYALNIKPLSTKLSKTACVIPTERHNNDNSIGWLKDQLSGFEHTIFLAFGTEDNNDYKTCQKLSQVAPNPKIYTHLSINNIIELISSCNKIFCYRLHGMILAHMLKKPYKVYAYHHKLTRNHETIKDLSVDDIRFRQKQELNKILSPLLISTIPTGV